MACVAVSGDHLCYFFLAPYTYLKMAVLSSKESLDIFIKGSLTQACADSVAQEDLPNMRAAELEGPGKHPGPLGQPPVGETVPLVLGAIRCERGDGRRSR